MSLKPFVLALALALSCCGPEVTMCLRPLEEIAALVRPAGASEPHLEDKPWFCHDLDCPQYKVINQSSTYETRLYEKAQWVLTRVEGLLYAPSQTVGFKRLFDYISGANANSTKVPMTSPVLTFVEPGQGPFCKSNFTVAFFVPFEYQSKAPQPNNSDVFLHTVPEATVYVSQFGGYLIDDFTLSAKVKALREALVAHSEPFKDDGDYATASYDPPFRVQHRHNEVWLRKKKSEGSPVFSN